MTVTGKLSVGTTLTANKVSAALMSADVVETGTLAAKAGDTIIVDGDFELTGDASGGGGGGGGGGGKGGGGMSFLAQRVVVDGVRQWQLVHFDDFDRKEGEEHLKDDPASTAHGWGNTHLGTCANDDDDDGSSTETNEVIVAGGAGAGGRDRFLGGHCKLGGDSKVGRVYEGLPEHTTVRIKASFHFLDRWEGETGFAAVDGHYVWADTADVSGIDARRGLNMCGGDSPDAKFGAPIDITMPHTGDKIKLEFGAKLAGKHPCDASWGVDDVMVYVR